MPIQVRVARRCERSVKIIDAPEVCVTRTQGLE
jgi:hypothetical protein